MRPLFKPLLLAISLCLSCLALAETRLVIDVQNPGAEINKNIYGQFTEHLGRGIYEGIWVGEDSDIPNTKGFRKDVVKALKDLHVPLMRWPGGCFADEYHWRDGIGPRDKRKVTINTTWGGVPDYNAFGTHEFFELAEMLGSEVYINGNLGTGSPREMAEWLEYMTADGESTLANLRRANGRDKPWKVHYFAIGNESWGCGGTMTPEYYSHLYRHYATFAKTPEDNRPVMIASGGHTDLTNWTEELMSMESSWSYRMDAIAHHYYTLPTGDWGTKGSAIGFDESEWFSTLKQTLRIEDFIKNNIAIMDKYDPEKKVGFYVDEWGTWYDTPEGENPGFLYQQNSLRDAVLAGVNLNIFHAYADRIKMSNIAQMVNVLQAMILTDKEKMVLTPTYHVFKMHIPFQGATVLPIKMENSTDYTYEDDSVMGVSASAALGKDGKVYLSLVNLDPNNSASLTVDGSSTFKRAKGFVLTSKEMDAHNTFSQPAYVKPEKYKATANKGKLTLELPAKSVVVVSLHN